MPGSGIPQNIDTGFRYLDFIRHLFFASQSFKASFNIVDVGIILLLFFNSSHFHRIFFEFIYVLHERLLNEYLLGLRRSCAMR